jgi:hypothetical protein
MAPNLKYWTGGKLARAFLSLPYNYVPVPKSLTQVMVIP